MAPIPFGLFNVDVHRVMLSQDLTSGDVTQE